LLGTFVVLIPIQVFIERITHGDFQGGFWAFYPRYFQGFYAFGGNFAWMGLHLWYLEVLFVFSLLTLPLCRFFLNRHKAGRLLKPERFLSRPLGIYFLFFPVAVVEMLVNLDPDGIGIRSFGGWSLFSYLMIFGLGFLIGLGKEIRKAIENQRYLSLLLSLILTVTGVVLMKSGISTRSIPFALLRSLNMWCWLFSFMGFARHHLGFSNRFIRYANPAVLPFYVLHQTVIVVIGYFLIPWQAGLHLKWPVLGIISFGAIIILYELLIRRFRISRFLFGMKS
jgi:hypothetical protein